MLTKWMCQQHLKYCLEQGCRYVIGTFAFSLSLIVLSICLIRFQSQLYQESLRPLSLYLNRQLNQFLLLFATERRWTEVMRGTKTWKSVSLCLLIFFEETLSNVYYTFNYPALFTLHRKYCISCIVSNWTIFYISMANLIDTLMEKSN